MSNSIAVINAGSSSVKFAIYQATRDEHCLFRGQVEGIGVAPRLEVADDKGGVVEDRILPGQGFDHDAAMREIIETGRALLKEESVIASFTAVSIMPRPCGSPKPFSMISPNSSRSRRCISRTTSLQSARS
jgi:acetate kinase